MGRIKRGFPWKKSSHQQAFTVTLPPAVSVGLLEFVQRAVAKEQLQESQVREGDIALIFLRSGLPRLDERQSTEFESQTQDRCGRS